MRSSKFNGNFLGTNNQFEELKKMAAGNKDLKAIKNWESQYIH